MHAILQAFTRIGVTIGLLAFSAARLTALDVRVVDAATRQPLAGATVAWRAADGQATRVTSDSAGHAKASLPSKIGGTVRLTVSKQGFAPMTMWWDADKAPAKFEFRLPEAQAIGGRVIDETGKPVAG